MADATQHKRSLQIEYAIPSNDNDDSRLFNPKGEHVVFKNDEGGYFTDVWKVDREPDTAGVMAGRGQGYVSIQLQGKPDEVARKLTNSARQHRLEAIFTYRDWKQDDEGIWTNIETIVMWGYVASTNFPEEGGGSIGIEVHVFGTISRNDKVGTSEEKLDCITGASSVKGGTIARNPSSIPPYGSETAGNWAEPLELT